VLALPMLLIALVIRAEDSGPATFSQERIGKDGRPFKMYKFRSMRVSAEAELGEVLSNNKSRQSNRVMFKDPTDPRVTRVGRFIRRWSLDELPQLLNVVGGEMSLVGPRPPLADEVQQYERDAIRRFKVKPGITGLWQTSGRANLSWDQTLRLDLYYVENWSAGLDIYLLLRTIKAVLTRDGAY
jgi:lipopolysaccharide/colanic/teichoic acid biosynthesis glycosyltransferase